MTVIIVLLSLWGCAATAAAFGFWHSNQDKDALIDEIVDRLNGRNSVLDAVRQENKNLRDELTRRTK